MLELYGYRDTELEDDEDDGDQGSCDLCDVCGAVLHYDGILPLLR